jgi:hypothetical protein
MTKKTILICLVLISFLFIQNHAGANLIKPVKHNSYNTNLDPSKDLLIQKLEELNGFLAAGDYDKAKALFILPSEIGEDVITSMMKKLIEQQEISADGIKILSKKGIFGKVAIVFPEKGKMRAEKNKLNPDECYGLKYQTAEVMAHWDGKEFKIFRLDDVGKVTE